MKQNTSIRIQEENGAPQHILEDQIELMQFLVATMMDNQINHMPQAMQNSGRPIKSIKERLKSKEGRIRGNLMGKRVDFSARTVITPDPNLELDQIGVPRSVAANLTTPEMVTPFNIDKLTKLVHRGLQYPGAKFLIHQDGMRTNLELRQSLMDTQLHIGDVVERQMQDDDVIIFNRQPTLHKMSMMGHRVKVLPYSTFRMNLSCTSPYNADFDGDEMNLHMPQSLLTRAEILIMMKVERNIVTPQSNKPVMGIVQDTLCACRLFTMRGTFMDKHQVMHLLMFMPDWDGKIPVPAVLRPKELWTGKQIFSLLIAEEVNLTKMHKVHDDKENKTRLKHVTPHDTAVVIESGKLITGTLCKSTMGSSGGGLLHVTRLECGHETTRKLYSHVQLLINNWLTAHGQSMGISDAVPEEATVKVILDQLHKARVAVKGYLQDAYRGRIKPTPGNTIRQTFENNVNSATNEALNTSGESVRRVLSRFNNFKGLLDAGSKGSNINISQIMATVAQQNVEGKRIPFGFNFRSLPHFVKDDYGPESRGFVFNSYLRGLTPSEFYFHAMGGREGLIDTAVKTAETGYIQRRLVKSMEGVSLFYDQSVRNCNGELVQLLYGEDGMAGEFLEHQKIPMIKSSAASFSRTYDFDLTKEEMQNYVSDEIAEHVSTDQDVQHRLAMDYVEMKKQRLMLRELRPDGDEGAVLPAGVDRLITNAQKLFKIDRKVPTNLSPITVLEELKSVCDRMVVVKGADALSKDAQQNATVLMNALVMSHLSPKRVMVEHHLTEEAFNWVLGEIEERFFKAVGNPGEMCGALAAQSLGEPATQMTLNTFHFAGVSAKSVTLGVPRLKEIINVSKNPKTPSLVIYLSQDARENKNEAKKVLNRLEHVTLKDITRSSQIYYDPEFENSCIVEDREMVQTHNDIEGGADDVNLSPWLLRIELDDHEFDSKDFEMSTIEDSIQAFFSSDLQLIASDDNDRGHRVLRIRIRTGAKAEVDDDEEEEEGGTDDQLLQQVEAQLLSDMTLIGISDIKKVYMSQPDSKQPTKQRIFINADDGKIEKSSEDWVLETDGSNLLEVMCDRDVDCVRTNTNDICEIFQCLGIEAVRKSIENEMNAVISFGGSYVNYRHLSLLCDIMTSRGGLMAITRFGINRQNTGPLMRCSFEETVDILMEAAAHAELDKLEGVSGNLMVGNLAPAGTGIFGLFLDEEQLQNALVQDVDTENPMAGLIMDDTMTPRTGGENTPFIADNTPAYGLGTPSYGGENTPGYQQNQGAWTPDPSAGASPGWSPAYGSASPSQGMSSPAYGNNGSASPGYNGASPGAASPGYGASPGASPGYSPSGASPGYSPTSPSYVLAAHSLSHVTQDFCTLVVGFISMFTEQFQIYLHVLHSFAVLPILCTF